MNTELGTKRISRLMLAYGLPAIASSLIAAVYNLVDQIFIGQRIGYIGNAATQVCYPITALCGALALLFGIGGSVMFNIMQGKDDREGSMKFAGTALASLALAGIGAGLFLAALGPWIVDMLGATEEVYPSALTYLRFITIGTPFLIFTTGATLFIRADGSPRYALYCSLVGTGLNVVLDYLFIFPMGLGIAGAGLATVIGQVTVFVMVIWYLRHFRSGALQRDNFRLSGAGPRIKQIVSIGAAASLNQATMLISQVVLNNALRYYGDLSTFGGSAALAGAGVVTKINMIFYFVMLGMSIGSEPIAGYNYGAGNYSRVKETYYRTLVFGLAVGAVETALFWLCPDLLLSIFGSGTANYQEFAIQYMHVFMLFVMISGVPAVSMNILSSIGRGKKGVIISLSKQIILILATLGLPMIFRLNGVLYAGIVADVLATLAAFLVLRPEFRDKLK